MEVNYKAYNLPFRYPFRISKGVKTHQPTLVVSIGAFGLVGYGEAPAITYYNISVDDMIKDLEAKLPVVKRFAFTEPERWWHFLHHLFPKNPFLVCALDIAGWDLYGKLCKKPLRNLWPKTVATEPLCDYTIGIDEIPVMVQKMKEKRWPIYKIKLGTDEDEAIVTELRKHTDAVFRIDANAAWTANEALEKINAFQHLGVEFIEQPLAKDDWEGSKYLYQHSPLPLIADESCIREADVQKCKDHFHGINIKLTKCSGLTPALRMIEEGRSLGLKIMVGSMNESSIGSAAIAHLLPQIDYVDADGPLLLSTDLATGLAYDADGRIATSGQPGLGINYQPQ